MPFDVVAWYESMQPTALAPIDAVEDDVYRTSGDDIYVKPRAPFLAGYMYQGISTPKYSELRQPSLKIPYRFYRSYLLGSNTYGTAFYNLFARPLPLYAGEKLQAHVMNATSEIQLVAAMLSDGIAKRADVENVRPTHNITGYVDQALTAGTWTHCAMTWDQDLPKGRYGIVGMLGATYKASAPTTGIARLKLLDTTWRPGVGINMSIGDKTELLHQGYSYGQGILWPLMREISFAHDQMPNVEILAGAANTDHIIELMLQKIA